MVDYITQFEERMWNDRGVGLANDNRRIYSV